MNDTGSSVLIWKVKEAISIPKRKHDYKQHQSRERIEWGPKLRHSLFLPFYVICVVIYRNEPTTICSVIPFNSSSKLSSFTIEACQWFFITVKRSVELAAGPQFVDLFHGNFSYIDFLQGLMGMEFLSNKLRRMPRPVRQWGSLWPSKYGIYKNVIKFLHTLLDRVESESPPKHDGGTAADMLHPLDFTARRLSCVCNWTFYSKRSDSKFLF